MQEEVFTSHSEWIAGLRDQYAALGSGGEVQPSGFGGFGEPQLHERFSKAVDFGKAVDFEEPVYRSMGGNGLSWQSTNDELDFDSEAPVYRSLGGFAGAGTVADTELEADATPNSHATWMQSMPPLVQRQSAFNRL